MGSGPVWVRLRQMLSLTQRSSNQASKLCRFFSYDNHFVNVALVPGKIMRPFLPIKLA